MVAAGALTIALAISASSGGGRLLLCRAKVVGDPALARADALVEAGRRSGGFLDYGVPCDDPAESARAARRAGLAHAVFATAAGGEGSRYVLVLSDAADEVKRAERTVDVAPGADAVRPLRSALSLLLGALPPKAGPRPVRMAAWAIAGAGAAALCLSAVYAAKAGDAAERANVAGDPASYTRALSEWKDARGTTNVLLGTGAAALAAGLTTRLAF